MAHPTGRKGISWPMALLLIPTAVSERGDQTQQRAGLLANEQQDQRRGTGEMGHLGGKEEKCVACV